MTFIQRGEATDGASSRPQAPPPGGRALAGSKARCPSCDQSGPREISSFDAPMSWRLRAGLPASGMGRQVRAIFMVLFALAAFVGLLGVALA